MSLEDPSSRPLHHIPERTIINSNSALEVFSLSNNRSKNCSFLSFFREYDITVLRDTHLYLNQKDDSSADFDEKKNNKKRLTSASLLHSSYMTGVENL